MKGLLEERNRMSESNRRRILILCGGTIYYGAEQIAVTMMRACLENGWEVECISNAWTDGRFPAAVARLGVPITKLHMGWIYISQWWWTIHSFLRWPGALLQFRRFQHRFQPDVIICFGYRPVFVFWPFLRTPLVVSLHEAVDPTARRFDLLPRCAAKAARFWACSSFLRSDLVAAGLPPEQVHSVLNATDSAVVPSRDRGAVREPIQFGVVGRLSEGKGQRIFLQAISLMSEAERRRGVYVLYGAGEAETVAELRRLADTLGVAESVRFAGYVGDQEAIYSEMDVLVMPVLAPEAFGLVVIEAGLRGIPVIASDLGGLPEIIEAGAGGLLVPPGQSQALRDAMCEMMEDTIRLREMGKRHEKRCRGLFSLERLAADLNREVDELMRSTAGKAGR